VSKVIKSGAGGNVRRAIVDADVFDAKLEADRLLADARAEAERVIAEAKSAADGELAAARDEAERLRRKAESEGRERGLGAVTELLVGARAAAARARAGAEAELRALAVRIAEKILGRELRIDAAAVVDVAAEALRHAGEPRELVVRCAAEDVEALERGKPRLVERCRAAQAVRFVADDRVGRGDCIVESELGVVDARLSTQLDAIERALRGEPE
jgi:flagellar biosynthesis/type III secretory pathway protein FliH